MKPFAIIIAASTVFTLALHAFHQLRKPPLYRGFERSVKTGFARQQQSLDLVYTGYYFAGNTENSLYLSNHNHAGHVVQFSKDLRQSTPLGIQLPALEYHTLKTTIDSPYFYVSEGSLGYMYHGRLDNPQGRLLVENLPFRQVTPIHPRFLATLRLQQRENILAGIRLADSPGQSLTYKPEKQVDGIFCTDGQLHYDPTDQLLVYLFQYRNQYLVLDTNLNLQRAAHTIDTITTAKIRVEQPDPNTYTLSAHALTVNKRSRLYRQHLYVQSGLVSDTEDPDVLKKWAIIDVYHVPSGTYRYSFYLPLRHEQEIITDFCVIDAHTLAALYHHFLVTFRLEDAPLP